MRTPQFRGCRLPVLVVLAALGGGCATAHDPRDPLEPVNRSIYQFNDHFDRVLLKPAATFYNTVTPPPVRGGVINFFGNFRDVTTAVNDLLQFKVADALSDAGRVIINSTVGIFGIFDVATRIGLKKHNEDFGQTLAVWGTPDGPFLMLPILGPSTTRDAVGLIGDYATDPEFYLFTEQPGSTLAGTIRVISVRSELLDSEKIFDAAAVDRYAFLRDAYLQRRHSMINDSRFPQGSQSGSEGRRKTLKEMEQELDAPDPPK